MVFGIWYLHKHIGSSSITDAKFSQLHRLPTCFLKNTYLESKTTRRQSEHLVGDHQRKESLKENTPFRTRHKSTRTTSWFCFTFCNACWLSAKSVSFFLPSSIVGFNRTWVLQQPWIRMSSLFIYMKSRRKTAKE